MSQVKGSDWKVGFKAAALDVIQNGTITITVSIWGIPGFSHSVDICSREAGPEGFPTCPFQQPITILDTNPGLPWFAPDGPYEGRFEIKDTNGVTFFCLTTSWMQANNHSISASK